MSSQGVERERSMFKEFRMKGEVTHRTYSGVILVVSVTRERLIVDEVILNEAEAIREHIRVL